MAWATYAGAWIFAAGLVAGGGAGCQGTPGPEPEAKTCRLTLIGASALAAGKRPVVRLEITLDSAEGRPGLTFSLAGEKTDETIVDDGGSGPALLRALQESRAGKPGAALAIGAGRMVPFADIVSAAQAGIAAGFAEIFLLQDPPIRHHEKELAAPLPLGFMRDIPSNFADPDVSLPEAGSYDLLDTDPAVGKLLVANLRRTGELIIMSRFADDGYLGRKPDFAAADLPRDNRGTPLFPLLLRADRQAKHFAVQKALVSAAEAGVSRAYFAVIPPAGAAEEGKKPAATPPPAASSPPAPQPAE